MRRTMTGISNYHSRSVILLMAVHMYNNAVSSVPGMSPFFACYGKTPQTPMAAVIERANAE